MPSAKLAVVKLLNVNTVFATSANNAVFAVAPVSIVPATNFVPFQTNTPLFKIPVVSTSAKTLTLICSTLARTRAVVKYKLEETSTTSAVEIT